MAGRSLSLLDDAEDVVLAQNEMLLTVDLHFGAGVLAEEDDVARLHVELANLAVLEDLAVAHGHDFALDRLLFRAIGDDDPALALLFFLDPLDDDAVLQRSNRHGFCLLVGSFGSGELRVGKAISRHPRSPSEALNFV